MKIIKLILSIILSLIIGCTSLLLLACAAPKLFGIYHMTADTGIMEPTIRKGSAVFINRKNIDISRDSIIAYNLPTAENKDLIVIRRIVSTTEDGLVTKGDANMDVDIGMINPDYVIGSYMFHIAGIGELLDRIDSENVYIISAWIIIGSIILILLLNLDWKALKKEPNQNKITETENKDEIIPGSEETSEIEKELKGYSEPVEIQIKESVEETFKN